LNFVFKRTIPSICELIVLSLYRIKVKKQYLLTISQLPAGDFLAINPLSVELSSIARDTDIVVISNMPITSHIEYDTD